MSLDLQWALFFVSASTFELSLSFGEKKKIQVKISQVESLFKKRDIIFSLQQEFVNELISLEV